jgi:hypothetical protein
VSARVVLGVDPGTSAEGCGLVVYDHAAQRLLWSACLGPEPALRVVRASGGTLHALGVGCVVDRIVVERVSATGRAGNDVIRAAELAGEFYEAARGASERHRLRRRDVLTALHVSGGSRDAQVRAYCIDAHGGTRAAALGRKAAPGPLYGVTSHAWQALGLVLADRIMADRDSAAG